VVVDIISLLRERERERERESSWKRNQKKNEEIGNSLM